MPEEKCIDDGDCFHAAWIAVSDISFILEEEVVLVHGVVSGQGALEGLRHDHAWVECNGFVFDYANGRKIICLVSVYYKIGHVIEEELKRYSVKDASCLGLAAGHSGPWSSSSIELYQKETEDG